MVATLEFSSTCNQSLAAIHPAADKLSYGFLAYFLESKYEEIRGLVGDGLRDGLNLEHVRSFSIPVPPLAEQRAIDCYLQAMDTKANRFIRAKRRMIELLNEQKQAIILQAVTRGLDPDVLLKPSGVDWFGDIPAHWQRGPLGRFWSVIDCKHLTVPFTDAGIPLVSVSEVQKAELDLTKAKRTSPRHYETLIEGGRRLRKGDIVYCRNTSVGAAAFIPTDDELAMGQDVCVIRSDFQNGRFLNYMLASPFMRMQLEPLLVGATIQRINVSKIRSLLAVVPPLAEQDSIVIRLDGELKNLQQGIHRAADSIALVREYRARLIADVVTGKLDVRSTVECIPTPVDQFLEALEDDLEQESDPLGPNENGDESDEGFDE